MLFVVAGAVLIAPYVINKFNRVLEEIVIPRQDMQVLQKRRAQQAAAGIPEDQRETTRRLICDAELTMDEAVQLNKMGAFDIIKRAQMRRPIVAKMEAEQDAA